MHGASFRHDAPQTVLLRLAAVSLSCQAGSTPDGCAYPKVQSLAQPCCEASGIDACGAGLFCAMLDGRTIATCYPNWVRMPGESCMADVQCVSGRCAASNVCVPALGMACDPKIGCAKGATCVSNDPKSAPTCQTIDGVICATDKDCTNPGAPYCRSGTCSGSAGKYAPEACTMASDCVSGSCYMGKCECYKGSSLGCPLGQACSGGSHAIYGTGCN
jgi:hypothetical protein